jgi:hypothetical protein
MTIRRLTVLAALLAPFFMVFMVCFALLIVPDGIQAVRNSSGVDWIWLILLGAMMLGIYYFLAVYLEDEEEIAKAFRRLDGDHDGYISREDGRSWPDLIRLFDRFASDHDGRLSHNDFEAFEKALAAH